MNYADIIAVLEWEDKCERRIKMSYNSPISVIIQMVDEHIKEVQKQEETAVVAEITRQMGVNIDKDELIRALNYDRHQYEKGYVDGRMSGKNEIESKLVHIETRFAIQKYRLNAEVEEWIKKKLCEDIGQYLYENNLVTFNETNWDFKSEDNYDRVTNDRIIFTADVQVYDEREGDEE